MKFVTVPFLFSVSDSSGIYPRSPFMQWYISCHVFTIAKIIDSCSTCMLLSPSFHHSARLLLSSVCSAWFLCSTWRKYILANINTFRKNWFFRFPFRCMFMHMNSKHQNSRNSVHPPPKTTHNCIIVKSRQVFRLNFPVVESTWIFW